MQRHAACDAGVFKPYSQSPGATEPYVLLTNDEKFILFYFLFNLFDKYDNTASIMNSDGRTTRQLTALTVALEKKQK